MNEEDIEFCPACKSRLIDDLYVANRKRCVTKDCQLDFIQGD